MRSIRNGRKERSDIRFNMFWSELKYVPSLNFGILMLNRVAIMHVCLIVNIASVRLPQDYGLVLNE